MSAQSFSKQTRCRSAKSPTARKQCQRNIDQVDTMQAQYVNDCADIQIFVVRVQLHVILCTFTMYMYIVQCTIVHSDQDFQFDISGSFNILQKIKRTNHNYQKQLSLPYMYRLRQNRFRFIILQKGFHYWSDS